jgi:hypothetical protein
MKNSKGLDPPNSYSNPLNQMGPNKILKVDDLTESQRHRENMS